MGVEIVVLDFDGTLTDVDKEAVPAIEGWKNDVGRDLGFTSEQIQQRWVAAESKIKANPIDYGWLRGDKIIAPACADPFVMATVITQVLFDEEGKYSDQSEREKVLGGFFSDNYRKATTVFKDGADEFLSELRKLFGVYIATNSDTSKVSGKIEQALSDHSAVPIYGDAKKYNLHPDWAEVPESVEREGFGRPLFLRRRQYYDVLQKIMGDKGVSSDQVAVVGDIYELDLLLPEYTGMRTVLTPRDSTADCELVAVSSAPKGYVTKDLVQVVQHLESDK